jgi:hypothetical protein
VTANFAIVQPSLQVDGPQILEAIVEATGGGKVPTLAELGGGRDAARDARMMRARNDPKLNKLLRAFIDKQASEEDIKTAAAGIEKYIAENEQARREVGRISNTIVNSERLSNYGNATTQKILREWAKKFPADASGQRNRKRRDTDN